MHGAIAHATPSCKGAENTAAARERPAEGMAAWPRAQERTWKSQIVQTEHVILSRAQIKYLVHQLTCQIPGGISRREPAQHAPPWRFVWSVQLGGKAKKTSGAKTANGPQKMQRRGAGRGGVPLSCLFLFSFFALRVELMRSAPYVDHRE